MLEYLEQQKKLTINQWKIFAAATIGDMLDFFDFLLIAFVLAFIVKDWNLTYGESGAILLASGISAPLGSLFYGWLADKIGRRKVMIITILNFSIATGLMALTPEHGWVFLVICRVLVGFGVTGLYTVDIAVVQEFVPAYRRGWITGVTTTMLPAGFLLGALLGQYVEAYVGWRGLFAIGLLPAALSLLIRAWVPESPHWLIRVGRLAEARQSLAWALMVDPREIQLPAVVGLSGAPLPFGACDVTWRGQAWRRAWEHVVPLFAFPPAIRKMIYTTNAVESLNRSLRKIIKTRGSFPTDEAALKLLFLAIRNAGVHWRRPIEWTAAVGQFAILFGDRFEPSAR